MNSFNLTGIFNVTGYIFTSNNVDDIYAKKRIIQAHLNININTNAQ